MIRYGDLFQNLRALAGTWTAAQMDDHIAQEDMLCSLRPDEVAELVQEFCTRAGEHVDEVGADAVGDVIWYLMGAGEEVWHRVAEASHEYAEDAVLSLRNLYERCFAPHLTEWRGVGIAEDRLGTACYMLWDMGGGLETIALFHEPKALVRACHTVLEHALSLESPACWESALHGIGHLVHRDPSPTQALVDRFLTRKRNRIPDELRKYADAARCGCVQ